MAQKQATKGKSAPKPANDKPIYVRCDLDKALKKQLVEWVEASKVDVWSEFERAVDSGLKIGLSYDNYNECVQASFTRMYTDTDDNNTYVLVGRGGNLLQAVQSLLFKHVIMFENGSWWTEERVNARGETDWG